MFMLVHLPCCLLLSGMPSISFRSCEDSFDHVRLSSSWTRSSSLRDFRQDDRYLGSHYYHCYASCFVLSLCRATYLLLLKPHQFPCQPLTFFILPSKPLFGYVTALLSPLIALLVAGEVEDCSMVDRIMFGISQYLLYY